MNLPNLITIGRLLSVPVIIYLLMQSAYQAAFGLFLLAGLSDAVDGYIAKSRNQRTRIGALLDPLADKTLLIAVYVTLGLQTHLPSWLIVLVVFRDVMIVGGIILLVLVGQDTSVRTLVISKINTAAQIGLAACILAELSWNFQLGWGSTFLVYFVAATTVTSGAGYILTWTRQIAGMENGDV